MFNPYCRETKGCFKPTVRGRERGGRVRGGTWEEGRRGCGCVGEGGVGWGGGWIV